MLRWYLIIVEHFIKRAVWQTIQFLLYPLDNDLSKYEKEKKKQFINKPEPWSINFESDYLNCGCV